jgi:hypothetical protein
VDRQLEKARQERRMKDMGAIWQTIASDKGNDYGM